MLPEFDHMDDMDNETDADEEDIDREFSHIIDCPCKNGGWCDSVASNRNLTVCHCPPGYSGQFCIVGKLQIQNTT